MMVKLCVCVYTHEHMHSGTLVFSENFIYVFMERKDHWKFLLCRKHFHYFPDLKMTLSSFTNPLLLWRLVLEFLDLLIYINFVYLECIHNTETI